MDNLFSKNKKAENKTSADTLNISHRQSDMETFSFCSSGSTDESQEGDSHSQTHLNTIKYVTLVDLPPLSKTDSTQKGKTKPLHNKEYADKNQIPEQNDKDMFKQLKNGALYSILAAGGMLGMYTLLKNTSASD